MSNGNFNTINVKQLNFTGDHIFKRGQPTMMATLDASGVGHHKRLCVDNLAVGKGDNDCIDLNYVLDVSGASKLNGPISDLNGTFGANGQVITSTVGGWTWQDPSNGGGTAPSNWTVGNNDGNSLTIYRPNTSGVLARVGIGNFSGQTTLNGQAKATLDVNTGGTSDSMRSTFKLGTISSTGVFQNAPFSAMMGDRNSLNGIDDSHGASFILGHSCTLTGWSCAAIGRHNVVNMPTPGSNYSSKGAIALGNYAYAGIKGTAAGIGDIGFAIGTGNEGTIAGEPTYSSNNNKFVIDISGNVGIGLNNPVTKLAVSGTSTNPTSATMDGAISQGIFRLNGTGGFHMDFGFQASSPHAGWIQTHNGTTNGTGDDLLLQPISGNVGIGTTSPGAKLEVKGDALNSGAIYIKSYPTTDKTFELRIRDDTTSSYPLHIGPINSFDGININNSNGNVGIGTANPSDLLTVSSSGNVAVLIDKNANTFSKIYNDGEIWLKGGDNSNQILLRTNGNNSYFLNSNVGIGTSSPGAKLEVNGTVKATAFDGVGTFSSVDISGGTINGTTIGASSASTGKFTSLEATNTITGSVNGSSASCTGNAATATKIDSITNSDIVQLTATQTLINKTLTSPTITSPTITGTLNANGVGVGSSGQVLSSTGTGLSWVNTTEHGPWSPTTNATSGIYYDSGNVGIGTNAPQVKLEVNGPTEISALDTGGIALTVSGSGKSWPGNVAMCIQYGDALIYGNIFGRGGGSNIANLAIGGNDAAATSALRNNTTGVANVAVGCGVLYGNTGGNYNTGIGVEALSSANSIGDYNTACGYKAGINCSGSKNTFIGEFSGPTSITAMTNVTCIGANARPTFSGGSVNNNEIILGDASIATLRCQVTSITGLSDARDKKNIIDIPYGLDLINNLQPRQFTWDIRGETEDNPHQGTTRVGFIAQEVQSVLGEDNAVLNMIHDFNPQKLELSYGQLVPVLTKAVQELSSELIAEKEKTAILESKLTTFEARLAALEAN